jgi:lipopolysaccharide transport protein LptA
MRFAVNILLLLSASGAAAFDSQAWLGKREVLAREAERLQGAYARTVKRIVAPAENITVPVESFPDGSVKSSVFAKKAQFFLDENLIWGEDVLVKSLGRDGKTESEIVADNCLVDRADSARSGWVDGHAKAVHGKMVLTGEQVYLSFAEEFVSVKRNAEVVAEELKFGEHSKGKKTGGKTVLKADRADYDRKEGVIMFEGSVTLDNPEYKLAADQIFAFVKGTNELRRIVAVGNVAVTNSMRYGYCERATYSRANSRLSMYASEERPARLIDASERRREVAGDRITFHLNSEQVEVDNPVMTIETGKEDFKL